MTHNCVLALSRNYYNNYGKLETDG